MKFFHSNKMAVLTAAVALFFTSCDNDKKNDDPQPKNNEIVLTSLSENDILNAGQTITITGTITGTRELHGYKIFVRQKADGKVLFTKSNHDHATKLTINQAWTLDTVARYKELELEVLAALDHDGNTTSKKMTLHALPAGQHNFATIAITSLNEHQMVKAAQQVTIQATINGLATMHGYEVIVRKKADNSVVFSKNDHVHAKTITVSVPWMVPAYSSHTDLELEIKSSLDHDGNAVSKKISFHAMS